MFTTVVYVHSTGPLSNYCGTKLFFIIPINVLASVVK